MSGVCYVYKADKNPNDEAYIPGVPLRDLTADDLTGMRPDLVAGVAACGFYERGDAPLPAVEPEAVEAVEAVEVKDDKAGKPGPSETAADVPAAVTTAKAKQPRPSETKTEGSSGE